ncbi:MAG TPA: FAD-dependent oxidoreductase [Nitrospiraceae bacterium]|nr:FAD-dependent oxidoreductase [Nitrospiraceae bacterium]
MTSNHNQSVVILGGDPAGLTAAYYLTHHGYRVTIVDHRPSFASSLIDEDVDNNPEPFTILGCHRATQALLHSLHPDLQQPEELAISLEFRLPDGSFVHYPRTSFPTPLHTWVNLLRFAGIPWKERWRLASWVEQLWEGDAQMPPDLEQRTADDWLASIGQSMQTRRVVWSPLALWLTGNDLSTMSADAFVRSIKPVFLGTRPDSRISVIQGSLHNSLVQPISDALRQGGATMLHNTEAAQLRYERECVSGVLLRNGSLLQADWYVAALPHEQLTSLLPEQWLTRYAYFQQLTELRSFDGATLHLQAEQPCTGPRLVLLGETPFHSVLLTAATPQHTRFSLVTTDNRFTQARPDSNLDVAVTGLLRSWSLLTVEPGIGSISLRAMSNSILSLKPGAKLHRPIQRSPIANLLVGGAWTDTGWPPNLESAIVSGKLCADAIATR